MRTTPKPLTHEPGDEAAPRQPAPEEPAAAIRVGISTCLLGQKVRFDGGHKQDRFITDTLGQYLEWVPVCPEVEVGMGTPRESIRLVQRGEDVRLVGTRSETDHTDAMRRYAKRRVEQLAGKGLCGYILKKDSPSCGFQRVRIYQESGMAVRSGRGMFTEALVERFPNLPVEDEGRLCDPRLRENWIERVLAYHRLQGMWAKRWTVGTLVAFHTAHKLTLLAHSPEGYRELGRLVAGAKAIPRADLREAYERDFMAAMTRMATARKHTNVLQHMVGYFRGSIDDASRDELLHTIEDYRTGLLPLIVPLTLVKHHVRRYDVAYLQGQTYLNPHPKELGLRNHV